MKKNFFLTIIIFTTAIAAQAQTGSILLYGDVGFSYNKENSGDNKTTFFDINPAVGYQFSKYWTIGIHTGFYHTVQSYNGSSLNNSTFNNYIAGPFIRYTKMLSPLFRCV